MHATVYAKCCENQRGHISDKESFTFYLTAMQIAVQADLIWTPCETSVGYLTM